MWNIPGKKQHMNTILDALQDYRRWFDSGSDKLKEIDAALKSFNQNAVLKPDINHSRDFFPITSISREDIIHAFEGDPQVTKRVMSMEDSEMAELASQLADDYCEQLFWDSLKVIFELNFK